MKKSILNIGTVLDKTEQRAINGGECPWGTCLNNFGRCSHIACIEE